MEGFSRPGSIGGEITDSNDVEGHVMDDQQGTQTEGQDEELDAEGHVVRLGATDDEDVEGHVVRLGATDDEDVEGHAVRLGAYG